MSEDIRTNVPEETEEKASLNFIEKIIEDDLANGRVPNNTLIIYITCVDRAENVTG